jgi:GNAT superfamily N-acetyltransferase
VAWALADPDGYTLERLDTALHDRSAFTCGTETLDRYLSSQAGQDQNKNISRSYVLIEVTARKLPLRPVVGFVSLASSELALMEASPSLRKLTKLPKLPALMLARMAVDHRHQGRRLGEFLLKVALKSACEISELAGCMVVLVDAKDAHAKAFYLKYGFVELPDQALRLYLPVETIKKGWPAPAGHGGA